MNKNKSLIVFPITVLIASTILVYFGILNHWFGETRPGIMKFCEFARDGFIKQPANTFSNLGFTFLGTYIAWFMFSKEIKEQNYFTKYDILPIILSIGFILTGAGSFAMHATNAHWGGFFDLFGMFFISSFMFAYAVKRWFLLSVNLFLFLFLTGVGISSYIYLTPSLNHLGWFFTGAEIIFIILLWIGIILEFLLVYVRNVNLNKALGIKSLASLLVAFFIWNLSINQDSLLCEPHSLLQGHAAWHLLDALGGYFLFKFYLSEKTQF